MFYSSRSWHEIAIKVNQNISINIWGVSLFELYRRFWNLLTRIIRWLDVAEFLRCYFVTEIYSLLRIKGIGRGPFVLPVFK